MGDDDKEKLSCEANGAHVETHGNVFGGQFSSKAMENPLSDRFGGHPLTHVNTVLAQF